MFIHKNPLLKASRYIIWYGFLLFFGYLMLLITLQYIPYNTDVAFLRIKQDVVHFWFYRVAFFSHVYTGMFVLMSGMLQFPALLRNRYRVFHRWCGWIYAILIIFITGPSGLVMGIFGNGGWISQTAFCTLAMLWVFFTWKAVVAAASGNISSHRNWMYRSYALTLSAISLRLWKWLFVLIFQPRPMDVYHIVSWLGWGGNLLIAEILIYYASKKNTKN
ncbi:MAG TPA: DUF2306 domain-containing protein [Mucilaginibacter sp.]|nr:DUF2306 domain-containing protein [Mucilaginibacter sp.]